MRNFTVFLACLFAITAARADTYYFSATTGYYSNQITPAQAQNQATPYRELSTLDSILHGKFPGITAPGNNFMLKAGEFFRGTLTPTVSGTPDKPITIGIWGGTQRAVVTGLEKVTDWTSEGGNIYTSPKLATRPYMVFVDGKFQKVGRWPNESEDAPYGFLQFDSHTNTTISDKDWGSYSKPTSDWTGGEIAFRQNRFRFNTFPVNQSVSGSTITFEFGSYQQSTVDGFGYFIQNHIKALDKDFEWCYNPTTQKVSVYLSDGAANHTIEVCQKDKLIDLGAVSYYNLQGIRVRASNGTGISKSGGTDVTFDNCEVVYARSTGIKATGVDNFVLKNSVVDSSLTFGISVKNDAGDTATLVDNIVTETMPVPGMNTTSGTQGSAIDIKGSGFLLQYNKIIHSGYAAINFNDGSNIRILNNILNGSNWQCDDGGIIYTVNQVYNFSYRNRIIDGNIVMNTDAGKSGRGTFGQGAFTFGMYADQYSNHITFSNNIFIGGRIGLYFNDPVSNTITGNIFYNIGTSGGTANSAAIQIQNKHIEGQPYTQAGSTPILRATSAIGISDNVIKDNVFFNRATANDPTKALWFNRASATTTLLKPTGYGDIDNNYYVYPYNKAATIFKTQIIASVGGWTTAKYTLPNWSSGLSYDKHSQLAPVYTTAGDTLILNDTKAQKTFSLAGATWVSAKGVAYNDNTITLAPYTAVALIKTGTYVSTVTPPVTPPVDAQKPINKAPVVTLTSPYNNGTFTAPATISIKATAKDVDGSITKVEFYWGSKLIHTENTAPYEWSWAKINKGTFAITAKAYDNAGATTTSAVSTIVVKDPVPTGSITPPPPSTTGIIKVKKINVKVL
jgi:hypothetical protein